MCNLKFPKSLFPVFSLDTHSLLVNSLVNIELPLAFLLIIMNN